MNHKIGDFFSEDEVGQITEAVRNAELNTSGEIRLHIEKQCPEKDVLDRTAKIFAELGMHKTQLRNGVLIYLAFDHRKFAIIGDAGINHVVEAGFWDSTRDIMQHHFKQGQFVTGLVKGIELAGENLKKHFPFHKDDINELSDEISIG